MAARLSSRRRPNTTTHSGSSPSPANRASSPCSSRSHSSGGSSGIAGGGVYNGHGYGSENGGYYSISAAGKATMVSSASLYSPLASSDMIVFGMTMKHFNKKANLVFIGKFVRMMFTSFCCNIVLRKKLEKI